MNAARKHLASLQREVAREEANRLALAPTMASGIHVAAAQASDSDDKTPRTASAQVRARLGLGGIVLAAHRGERVTCIVTMTPDLGSELNAGKLAAADDQLQGDTSGGRPDSNQDGDKDRNQLPAALNVGAFRTQEDLRQPENCENMEEQVLFFTSQGKSLRLLQQMARGGTRHLILVFPEDLGRLQMNLFLRLVRRRIAGQAHPLTVVSGNRQARILAEQLGFASAVTLDEARGVLPGKTPTPSRSSRQSLTSATFPRLPALGTDASPSAPPASPASAAAPSLPASIGPNTHLEHLLRGGYLPNPAAIPSLEEEAQRAAREEDAHRSRLIYEIADEHTPTLAQEESEEHEAQIISTILKTSHPLSAPEAPDAQPPPVPHNQTNFTQAAGASGSGQGSGTLRAEHNPDEQAPGTNNPKP